MSVKRYFKKYIKRAAAGFNICRADVIGGTLQTYDFKLIDINTTQIQTINLIEMMKQYLHFFHIFKLLCFDLLDTVYDQTYLACIGLLSRNDPV